MNGMERLLMRFGVTPNYTGFRQVLEAVREAEGRPESLLQVSKRLYPAVAGRCGTTWKAVERNIRAMAAIAWQNDPALLCDLAGRRLECCPKSAQFIAILAASAEKNGKEP